jgi:hypothetical protein
VAGKKDEQGQEKKRESVVHVIERLSFGRIAQPQRTIAFQHVLQRFGH